MLSVNTLAGFASNNTSIGLRYNSFNSSTSDLSSYTFSAQSIGPASSDRHVVVCAFGKDASSLTINSCTVGGAATTRLVERTGTAHGAIFVTNAPVKSGTTADIIVNMSGVGSRCAIFVYSLTTVRSPTTTLGTISVAETDPSEPISVSAGGVVIAMAANSVSTATITWTGVTQDGGGSIESADALFAASKLCTTTETLTITANFTSSSGDMMVAASWGP